MALIAHYKLNDNAANTTVADSAGSYTGTASANTSTLTAEGKINAAFNFAGTYVAVSGLSIADNAPLSVCAWVYLDDWTTEVYPQFICLAESTNGANARPLRIGFSNQSGYTGVFFGASGFWPKRKSDTNPATLNGAWQHVVLTYNGSDRTNSANFAVYLNGNLLTMSDAGAFSGATNTTQFGALSVVGSTERWDGKLDDIRIYNEVISAAMIASIYNGGSGTEVSIITISPPPTVFGLATDFEFTPPTPHGATLDATFDFTHPTPKTIGLTKL